MATVYLAVSRGPAGFSKLKVIKRLHHDLASDPQAVQMFTDEARVTALLNHPNIVQMHEIMHDGDEYVLEMEYLDGQSLESLTKRAAPKGGVPLPLGVFVLTQVLAGLHYAHELEDGGAHLAVVHRDVSPHNVMVTYEGAVKVLDFGIAKARDSNVKTESGLVRGKVSYMSPEQATRGIVDRRADVFAVGVMLWQFLTRTRIWAGLGDLEILLRLSSGDIPSPSTVQGDVPPALEAICMRALASKAEDRFSTAAEMQASLEEVLETTAPRTGPKQLAKLACDLFAETRPAMRAQIDRRLAAIAHGKTDVEGEGEDAPEEDSTKIERLVTTDPSARTTRGGTITKATVSSPTRRAGRTEEKGSWVQRGAFALALLAMVAVSTFLWWRRPAPSPVMATPSAPSTSSGSACASSSTCGEKRVCRGGSCVALDSVDCHVVGAPDVLESDATLFLGVMFPHAGPNSDADSIRAIELAREDFMSQMSGLPTKSGTGRSRPLALVVCDDDVDPMRAAKHLVSDVGVPAVIGFGSSKEVIDLATSVFIPAGVLTLAATNSSPFIASIPQPPNGPRLVWRTTLNAAYGVTPLALFVSQIIEPRIRENLKGAEKTAPIRVAFVRGDNTVGVGLSGALFSTLRFNGKSVMDNGASFTELVYPWQSDAPADYVSVVDAAIEETPHLFVVNASGHDLTRALYSEIEARWPAGAQKPTFVVIDYPHGDEFLAFLAGDAGRKARYFGVTAPPRTETNVKFTMRYNEKAKVPVTLATSPGDAYDAFYVMAYAAFVIGDAPITGASLAQAIPRLVPPGPRIEVGRADMFEAFRVLRAGGNIDLAGAGSALDFDLAAGESANDIVLLCGRAGSKGKTVLAESGLYFDARTRKVAGKFDCP
jgi:serine/threonine protein kinase/ABC-type branched-subunit amino acid transport system substrate-binding protein